MFNKYDFEGRSIGFSTQWGNAFFFFGNRNFPSADFSKVFPQFQFRMLKQVHGDAVVCSQSHVQTADAHWTEETNVALVVQTADCLPVLFASAHAVAACHAGWRGVANGIIGLTAQQISDADRIAIGPHLQRPSFEVGLDVAAQISRAVPEDLSVGLRFQHQSPDKCYMDLAQAARIQIQQSLSSSVAQEHLAIDTMLDLSFHSYRRDGSRAERQYSFVARTS